MRNLILLLALLISALATNAQNYTISGYITDETDGETLMVHLLTKSQRVMPPTTSFTTQ